MRMLKKIWLLTECLIIIVGLTKMVSLICFVHVGRQNHNQSNSIIEVRNYPIDWIFRSSLSSLRVTNVKHFFPCGLEPNNQNVHEGKTVVK